MTRSRRVRDAEMMVCDCLRLAGVIDLPRHRRKPPSRSARPCVISRPSLSSAGSSGRARGVKRGMVDVLADGVPPDVLVFGRDPGLFCVVNLSDSPYPLPEHQNRDLADYATPTHRAAVGVWMWTVQPGYRAPVPWS